MKASAAIFILTLLAGSALAQETTTNTNRPDFSRSGVQRFVMSLDIEEEDEIRARYDPLRTNFTAFGTTWRIGVPGLMMPLAGTQLGVTQTWPDAFSLTNTQIATGPRAWRTQRAFRRELRDINRRLDAAVKVRTE